MNFQDWYTDTVDIWRVVPTTTNSLTTNSLTELYTDVPCRIYQSDNQPINMEQTAAHIWRGNSRTGAPRGPPAATGDCEMTLEERIRQLQDVQARFPSELSNIAKNATIRAVEKAVDMTPPTR